jgi:heptosyltransferase I
VLRLRRELRAFKPQLVIDLQGLTKSAVAAWLSGAPKRIGMARPDARELSPWLNNRLVAPTAAHVVDRYLQLLAPLGIERASVRFGLPSNEADDAAMARFILDRGLGSGFALINPGAGWASKRWPPERLAAVARHLGGRRHLPSIVVWAGNEERAWADRIITTSAGMAHMAPPTTLGELAALARRAKMFLGSDTGPLHLAAAVGTPCVGLYGPVSAERNGPYGSQHIAIQRACLTGSSRSRRRASDETMRMISVQDVSTACDRILESHAEQEPALDPIWQFPTATAA